MEEGERILDGEQRIALPDLRLDLRLDRSRSLIGKLSGPRARFVVGAASYWNFPTFAAGATTRTFTSASSFCSATALRTSSFGTRSSAMSSTFRELMPLVCHLEGRETTLSSLLGPVREDAAPRVLRSPDSGPQALELDDLAVIDEEVDAGPVLLHVPAEDFRFGRFEHHSL